MIPKMKILQERHRYHIKTANVWLNDNVIYLSMQIMRKDRPSVFGLHDTLIVHKFLYDKFVQIINIGTPCQILDTTKLKLVFMIVGLVVIHNYRTSKMSYPCLLRFLRKNNTMVQIVGYMLSQNRFVQGTNPTI